MKTDSLFYRLFQTDPALVLELAGLAVPEPERYRFGSQEIKQTSFRLDGVLEPPADQLDAPVVFVEVQFQPDEGFYLRFFSELLLYLRQYQPQHPWHAVVLYPAPTIERLNPLNRPLLALPNLHRIVLTELPLLASPNPKLWLIALILVEESEVREIVSRVQTHRRQHPSDGIDWLELLETVLVYNLNSASVVYTRI
jgi:predicted transposase/invertase (TIGR01784 family)